MPRDATALSASAERRQMRRDPMRWAVCLLLFAATAINYMDRSVLGILAHTLHEDLHWTEQQYGNIVVAFTLAYGLGYIGAGRLVDRLGTKRSYALCVLFWTLAAMGHSLVTTVIGFAVARFTLGLAESGNFPAAVRAVTEWFAPDERALATGLFNAGSNAAALVAPFLVARLLSTFHNWRAGFVGVGVLGLVWLVFWMAFPYDRSRRAQENMQEPQSTETDKNVYLRLLRQRSMWALIITKSFTDPVWWLYLFWLPKFLQERFHLSLDQIGWPLALVYCASSVGAVVGGWTSGVCIRRGLCAIDARKVVLGVCAVLALSLIAATHLSTIHSVVVLFSLLTAAHQAWAANLFVANSDLFPRSVLSTAVGIGGATGALGGVCFQWFTGHMLQVTHGDYTPVFLVAALAYPVSFVAFHLLTRNASELQQAAA